MHAHEYRLLGTSCCVEKEHNQAWIPRKGGGGAVPCVLYRDVILDRVWFLASLL